MLNKFLIIFLILFNFTSGQKLFSEEESNNLENILEWEEVKYSKGYQVQIRNSNKKLIIDEKVNDNKFKIKLSEGSYEQRLGVYNKFGKISGFSEWEKITVNKVYIPEVKSDFIEIQPIPENQAITIKGNNFSSDIKIYLKSRDDKIILKSFNINSDKEIVLNLSLTQNSLGKYDLVLINPRNKKIRISNFLNVVEKREDVVSTNQRYVEEISPIINDTIKSDKGNLVSNNFNLNSGWRSALIPGWGQYYKEEKTKSIIYFSTFFSGLLYFNTLYKDYSEAKSNYESTSNYGLLYGGYQGSGAGSLVLYNYIQSESIYNETISKGTRASQMAIGLQLIYIVNLLDALFFNSSPKQSSNENFNIISEYKVQSFGVGIPLNSQYDIGIKWKF